MIGENATGFNKMQLTNEANPIEAYPKNDNVNKRKVPGITMTFEYLTILTASHVLIKYATTQLIKNPAVIVLLLFTLINLLEKFTAPA
jgi:hypothetical protein